MFVRITMFVILFVMLMSLVAIQYDSYGFQWWTWNWQPELAIAFVWGTIWGGAATGLWMKEERSIQLGKWLKTYTFQHNTDIDWSLNADMIMQRIEWEEKDNN